MTAQAQDRSASFEVTGGIPTRVGQVARDMPGQEPEEVPATPTPFRICQVPLVVEAVVEAAVVKVDAEVAVEAVASASWPSIPRWWFMPAPSKRGAVVMAAMAVASTMQGY